MDELEKIAEYLYNCDNGIFPDRTVIIEWRLASEGDKAEYYRRADQILAFIKQAGYVRLADDQTVPQNTSDYDDWGGESYNMLKSGFRRVEL